VSTGLWENRSPFAIEALGYSGDIEFQIDGFATYGEPVGGCEMVEPAAQVGIFG